MTIYALNIGGGPKFKAEGWLNLDAVGPSPYELSPSCTLPVSDASLDLVYSSHTLEHLNDATVARVLDESRRVLRPNGTLLIKIPDFDLILDAYQRGDADFFRRWPNIRTMTETCRSRGVEPTTAAIACQCFCGFWNKAFGDMFHGYDAKAPGAYYGPPVLTEAQYQTVMAEASPHLIAISLCAEVIAKERDYTFNHQNAWSYDEFSDVLLGSNFIVTNAFAEHVIAAHGNVPGIEAQCDISAYYEARCCA